MTDESKKVNWFHKVYSEWKKAILASLIGLSITGLGSLGVAIYHHLNESVNNISESEAIDIAKSQIGDSSEFAIPFKIYSHPTQFIVVWLGSLGESERFRSETGSYGNVAVLEGNDRVFFEHPERMSLITPDRISSEPSKAELVPEFFGFVELKKDQTRYIYTVTEDYGSQGGGVGLNLYDPVNKKSFWIWASWENGKGYTLEIPSEIKNSPDELAWVTKKLSEVASFGEVKTVVEIK